MIKELIKPMVVAALVKKYFTRFANAGAVDPGNAKTLVSLGLDGGDFISRLIHKGILLESEKGKYYVNADRYKKYCSNRNRNLILLLAGLPALGYMIYLFL